MYCKNCGKKLSIFGDICGQCEISINNEKEIKTAIINDIEKAKIGIGSSKILAIMVVFLIYCIVRWFVSLIIHPMSEYEDVRGWMMVIACHLAPFYVIFMVGFLSDVMGVKKKYAPCLENIKKQYLNDNVSSDIKMIISDEEKKMRSFYLMAKFLIPMAIILLTIVIGVELCIFISLTF